MKHIAIIGLLALAGCSDAPVTHCDANRLHLGMSSEELTTVCGLPTTINAGQYAAGLHEQWVYANKVNVYVEDQRVTSWQWHY
jgi:hypothetical protein